MSIELNDLQKKAKGGTEMMVERLNTLPSDLLSHFQIIPSRVEKLDPNKVRVLWCHDTAQDPMNHHLQNNGWKRFHKIVFVSHWQREQFKLFYGIPHSRTAVIRNAVEIECDDGFCNDRPLEDDKINLIYHTTPHRGLSLLVPVFKELAQKYPQIHLDVYSSFKIYGWEERDEQFKDLFDQIKDHPQMSYHGTVSNEEVREALKRAHIFAYPSIWPETSCLALIEALASGCLSVVPDYAALPETGENWAMFYPWHEDEEEHKKTFKKALDLAIQGHDIDGSSDQIDYYEKFYSWRSRRVQWINFLTTIKDLPTKIEDAKPDFVYRTPI